MSTRKKEETAGISTETEVIVENGAKETEVIVENSVKESKKAKQSAKVIYVGPTIKGIAIANTIYAGGLPKELEEKLTELPAMKALLVTPEKLAETKRALQTAGSAEQICYQKVIDSMKRR